MSRWGSETFPSIREYPAAISTISSYRSRTLRLFDGRSGRAGGYVLARTADEIKLGDIIEAAIGPVAITDCAVEPELCIFSDYCNCKDLWMLINRRITAVLDEYTLADMLSESWPAKGTRRAAQDGC